jgi:hypothetical protein
MPVDIEVRKLSMKNDDDKLNELVCILKNNTGYLSFWLRPFSIDYGLKVRKYRY